MKKSSIAMFAAAAAVFASTVSRAGQETGYIDLSQDDTVAGAPWTAVALGIASPLQLPAVAWNWDVYGIRFSPFYSDGREMAGFDLGLAGRNCASFAGWQIQGLGSWVRNDFTGWQIAGLADATLGNFAGWQIGGLCNYVKGSFDGWQIGAVNIDGSFAGWQIGAANIDMGTSRGWLLGGANIAADGFSGLSTGAFNYAMVFEGCQIGVVNIVADKGQGVQIGVYNGANNWKGIQIGLLNVIPDAPLYCFPVMNANF